MVEIIVCCALAVVIVIALRVFPKKNPEDTVAHSARTTMVTMPTKKIPPAPVLQSALAHSPRLRQRWLETAARRAARKARRQAVRFNRRLQRGR